MVCSQTTTGERLRTGRIPQDTETAARLAVEARRKCSAQGTVQILGCLPPVCESHRPDLTARFIEEEGEQACINFYRTVGEALLRDGADALLAETMNSREEARLAIEATKDLGVSLLICMEGSLRSQTLQPQPHLAPQMAAKVLEAKAQGAPIEALGFNCAPPEDILAELRAIEVSGHGDLLKLAGVKLAAYSSINDRKAVHDAGFDVKKFLSAAPIRVREDLEGDGYIAWCDRFIRHGASYCGGWCLCIPTQIRDLSAMLQRTEESSDSEKFRPKTNPPYPPACRSMNTRCREAWPR